MLAQGLRHRADDSNRSGVVRRRRCRLGQVAEAAQEPGKWERGKPQLASGAEPATVVGRAPVLEADPAIARVRLVVVVRATARVLRIAAVPATGGARLRAAPRRQADPADSAGVDPGSRGVVGSVVESTRSAFAVMV